LTTCIVTLATEYIEARKILIPEYEGYWADRSCSRASTHLSLSVEDAHTHKKDIILCYFDFKGAFSSTGHRKLVKVLEFLGLPHDFTRLVSNLYREASTEFITPYNHTPPWVSEGALFKGTPCPHYFSTL
jgi:hypothetical protein